MGPNHPNTNPGGNISQAGYFFEAGFSDLMPVRLADLSKIANYCLRPFHDGLTRRLCLTLSQQAGSYCLMAIRSALMLSSPGLNPDSAHKRKEGACP